MRPFPDFLTSFNIECRAGDAGFPFVFIFNA